MVRRVAGIVLRPDAILDDEMVGSMIEEEHVRRPDERVGAQRDVMAREENDGRGPAIADRELLDHEIGDVLEG